MSLRQQCLPLPRRRKHQFYPKNKSYKKDGNGNGNGNNNAMEEEEYDHNDFYMPTKISELSDMDADTYLAAVSAQASSLPFVFVADAATTTATSTKHTSKEQTQDEQVLKNDSSSLNNNNSNSNNPYHHNGDNNNEAKWQGSAMSIQYLYSNRLKIKPPPSIQHIPPIVRSQKVSMEEYSNVLIHDFSTLRLFLHNCLNTESLSSFSSSLEESDDNQKGEAMDEDDNDDDNDDDLKMIFQNKIKNTT